VFLNKCYFYCTLSRQAEFPNYPKFCLSEIVSAPFISDNRGSTVIGYLNAKYKFLITDNLHFPLMALESRKDLLGDEVHGVTEPEGEATNDKGTGNIDLLLCEFFSLWENKRPSEGPKGRVVSCCGQLLDSRMTKVCLCLSLSLSLSFSIHLYMYV
jgi:hypothetical protein